MKSHIDCIIAELAPLFKQAREAHEQFRADWDKNFPEMGQGYKETMLYQNRLNNMRVAESEVDGRILPIIAELKEGKQARIDVALAYLAVHDQYFHSGHRKEAIIKTLKRIDLSVDAKDLLHAIWRSERQSLSSNEKREFLKLLESFQPSI